MLDPRKVKLNKGKLVIEINNNARLGGILTTKRIAQTNNTGRIIHWSYDDAGRPNCNLPAGTRLGDTVFFKSRFLKDRKANFEEPFEYCDVFDDSDIFGVMRNEVFYPTGRKILVERMNRGFVMRSGLIEVPGAQPTTDQSHWVRYIRRGLPIFEWHNMPKEFAQASGQKKVWQEQRFRVNYEGLIPGCLAKLTGWKETILEVLLPGKQYGLIIDEDDIAAFYPEGAEEAMI